MIVYEDKEIIVYHKPAGLPVQSASVREKDLVSILKNEAGGDIFTVHRLDQPVEGLLVFARTKRAAADLSGQAADGAMRKLYHAACEVQKGVTVKPGEAVSLKDYLIRDGKENKSRIADKEEPGAKPAELSYRILKTRYTGVRYALAEIELKTGRHHQIRVQMAHAGLPLVGDRKYNPSCSAGEEEQPLALCAVLLSFRHPTTKKRMSFEITPEWEERTH